MFLTAEIIDFNEIDLSNVKNKIGEDDISSFQLLKNDALDNLKDYLLEGKNSLDGDKIQSYLFPQKKEVDIFLSHSHNDEEKVMEFAVQLQRKGLNVFVDSCVWGNVFSLLRKIDDEYCEGSKQGNYDYNKRNYSTSHVYMMLNTAIHKMIDECELFLFLGTPESIMIKNAMSGKKALRSPWIYSELSFTQHVRKKSKYFQEYLNYSHEDRVIAEDAEYEFTLSILYDQPNLKNKIDYKKMESFLEQKHADDKKILLLELIKLMEKT